MQGRRDDSWKRLLIDVLKKLDIITDNWTGELTIGIAEGGIKFIRKSETLK